MAKPKIIQDIDQLSGISGWIFAEVTGTTSDISNSPVSQPFPSGFTYLNTYIIQTMIDIGTTAYPIVDSSAFYSYTTSGGIGILVAESTYLSKPYKTLLAHR